MAGVKMSALPVIPSAPALTDSFAEIQPTTNGVTYRTTLQQLLDLYILNYAGDPNSNVAGHIYQLLWDTSNDVMYVCTTTGDAASAVWTTITPELIAGTGITITPGAGTLTFSTTLTLAASTYLPTLTNVTNLDASTAFTCQYMRVGSVVTVSGKVSVDPTAGASTELGISLPIASNLAAAEQCAGAAFASGIAGQGAAIIGDATNNRAQMQWIAVDTSNQPMYFSFTYLIV